MQETVVKTTQEIGSAIEHRKSETGMCWEKFAEITGLSCDTILKWHNRKRGCFTETVLCALDALGLEMVIREKNGGNTAC